MLLSFKKIIYLYILADGWTIFNGDILKDFCVEDDLWNSLHFDFVLLQMFSLEALPNVIINCWFFTVLHIVI